METIDTWKKKQESDSLFSLREGANPILKFVDVGKANRVNSSRQGWIFTTLRMTAAYMKWPWCADFVDFLEDYQTTCQLPHGARDYLLEAIQFTELAAHDKNRVSFNMLTDGKK